MYFSEMEGQHLEGEGAAFVINVNLILQNTFGGCAEIPLPTVKLSVRSRGEPAAALGLEDQWRPAVRAFGDAVSQGGWREALIPRGPYLCAYHGPGVALGTEGRLS